MEDAKKHLDDLTQIRALMERSSRFISLSGLSGVVAGLSALVGALALCLYLGQFPTDDYLLNQLFTGPQGIEWNVFLFMAIDGGLIVLVALMGAYYFTNRKAQRQQQRIWSPASRRLMAHMAIPLAAGGLLCLILVYHRDLIYVAPVTLIFYGLALVNASKYTLDEILYLGISEVALGLVATFYYGNGLIFWMLGFGILHIVYGGLMYFRHER